MQPESGAKVEALIREVYSYPPDAVKIATQVMPAKP